MKTFIKWPGNKSKYLKYIISELPKEYNNYIEPFLGSGALFLHLCPQKAIINDLNTDLINIWKLIKDDIHFIVHLFQRFKKIFVPMDYKKKLIFCRKITNGFNFSKSNKYKTVLMLLMTYCAYMGIVLIKNKYRFQGLEKKIFIDDKYYFLDDNYFDKLREINLFLNNSNIKIYNKDYKKILDVAKPNDFVFLDPPYLLETNDLGFNYNKFEKIDINFIKELLMECQKLDEKGVKWLMTQTDSDDIKMLFKKYTITKFPVYRYFKQEYCNELLIKNY